MLTRATVVKNLAFLVVAVLVLGFIGVRYADLGRYVGLRGYYTVDVQLPETGGLFEHADVTYRGVSVGRVGPIRLTADGVQAQLRINNSAPRIPDHLTAVVASLSAVGEQYIDLQPSTSDGPYLHGGSTIVQASTKVPAPVTNLLTSVNDLAQSVPLDSLRTDVDELGKAFSGQGDNLQSLLDTSSEFLTAADANLPGNIQLIQDGQTVLRTQAGESDAIKNFATSAHQLAAQLDDSDTDLRRLIAAAPGAATQVSALLRDVGPNLSVVLANLLTTSDIAVTRQSGIQEFLVKMPAVAAAGSSAVKDGKLNFGLAVTFFSPLPCTSGYGGTTYRNGLDTSPPTTAFNTAARCTSPASSGIDVRGSAHAPGSGAVPTPAQPGSVLPTDAQPPAAATPPVSTAGRAAGPALPGALGLPALPAAGPTTMAGLLGLEDPR
ncbi:phospholipid/cholesterol/gamma-HCH transport system substrate-binding protein [Actinacidiphila yanglinensis]|uniref:Phospholipid/cholesterol/gamma-HCH transport system substrate-binding protein n=1 Tax=Actinacidiphila yanglinensis TaxID=310779 RepID=A0A1H5T4Y4_9ACTN|nr:MlaD family protein [Actinacidiphila yanglinensis]SEF57856.1 phospholipid/cholesterol/gamma-HCH transport system substrate-binding protein [Actinacidiphila yanglinensis]